MAVSMAASCTRFVVMRGCVVVAPVLGGRPGAVASETADSGVSISFSSITARAAAAAGEGSGARSMTLSVY
eukprot:scaffold78940_cov33-Tisochrysis_lutea.AAC.1